MILPMRKLHLLPAILLIILPLAAVFSCQSSVETALESTVTTGTGTQPVRGGTLRIIAGLEPTMLSYPPLMSPEDGSRVIPCVERLMDWNPDKEQGNSLKPVLAESVDVDIANNRIVFHLRAGVKFQDGSPMNADAVIWNFKLLKDAGALQYANYWKDIKNIEDLTVETTIQNIITSSSKAGVCWAYSQKSPGKRHPQEMYRKVIIGRALTW
jgi:ABC-type transport system substrate-binding protein